MHTPVHHSLHQADFTGTCFLPLQSVRLLFGKKPSWQKDILSPLGNCGYPHVEAMHDRRAALYTTSSAKGESLTAIQRNFCFVQCQVSARTIEQRNESASLAITLNRANRKQAMLDAINDNDFLWRPVHRVQLQRQERAGKQLLAFVRASGNRDQATLFWSPCSEGRSLEVRHAGQWY